MIKKSIQEIEQTAITEIALLIGEFGELFASRTTGIKVGALDVVEADWIKLQQTTEKVYRRMVGELIDSVDERHMIAKKKRSGASAGLN